MTKTNTDKNFIPISEEQLKEIERTEERKNRFSGESILLTKEEARIHDCIFLAEIMATLEDKNKGEGESKHWQIMRDHLNWFRKNNAKAYMVLLD